MVNFQLPRFLGLEPWSPNIEIVECVAEGRTFDLHNECTLQDAVITCAPKLELWLHLAEDASDLRIELGFLGVQQLRFQQDDRASEPGNWLPSEVETLIGIEFTPSVNGLPRFTVETIIGVYTFACVVVEFRLGLPRALTP